MRTLITSFNLFLCIADLDDPLADLNLSEDENQTQKNSKPAVASETQSKPRPNTDLSKGKSTLMGDLFGNDNANSDTKIIMVPSKPLANEGKELKGDNRNRYWKIIECHELLLSLFIMKSAFCSALKLFR